MSHLQQHTTGPFQKGTRVLVDGEHHGVVERWCGGADYLVLMTETTGKTTRQVRVAVESKRLTVKDSAPPPVAGMVTK